MKNRNLYRSSEREGIELSYIINFKYAELTIPSASTQEKNIDAVWVTQDMWIKKGAYPTFQENMGDNRTTVIDIPSHMIYEK